MLREVWKMNSFYNFLKNLSENENPYAGATYDLIRDALGQNIEGCFNYKYKCAFNYTLNKLDIAHSMLTDFPKFFNYIMHNVHDQFEIVDYSKLKKEIVFTNKFDHNNKIVGKVGDEVMAKIKFANIYDQSSVYYMPSSYDTSISNRINTTIDDYLNNVDFFSNLLDADLTDHHKFYCIELWRGLKKPAGFFIFGIDSIDDINFDKNTTIKRFCYFCHELERLKINIDYKEFFVELVEFLNESIPSMRQPNIREHVENVIEFFCEEKLKPIADEHENNINKENS